MCSSSPQHGGLVSVCVCGAGRWLMAVCCVLPMETVVFSCKYPAMAIGNGTTVSPFLSWEPW